VTKVGSKWQAQIASCGVNRYLGRFDTVQAAARAYDLAAREFDGNSTRCNYKNEEEVAEDAKGEIQANEVMGDQGGVHGAADAANAGEETALADLACNGANTCLMAQEVTQSYLQELLKANHGTQGGSADANGLHGIHETNSKQQLVAAHVQEYMDTYCRMGGGVDNVSSVEVQRHLEEVLHCDLTEHAQLISHVLQKITAPKLSTVQPKQELHTKEHRKLVACVREYIDKSSRMGLEVDKMSGEEIQRQLEKMLRCELAVHGKLIRESAFCMQVSDIGYSCIG
jgi:hypothetical protein